ncbi:MAG: EAL domain-containing protein [Kangiella sp.]|jgi:diguanylate cyclase (GGDEF)-like protein/PAS domain S-box-containing protein|nr:EAL domain-containing protein [Kangiella sp.]MCW9028187.1 EAL domain-containing protein [Kangiella sp.]
MKKQSNNSPVNTLIFSNSANDSEQLASHLKNQGLPIRHQVVANSEQLKAAIDEKQWQQALFLDELDNLPIQQALTLLKSQKQSVPAILLSSNYSEEQRFDAIAKGAKDCIPNNAKDLLTLVVQRELKLVNAESKLIESSKLVSEISKRNQLLLESSKDAIAYIHDGMHIYTNPAYLERFGYEEDDIIVMTIMDLIDSEDTNKIKSLLKEQAKSGEEVNQVLKGKNANGETFEADFIVSSAIYDDEHCVQLVVREVSDQSELLKKLKEVSEIDQVTGIYNRPAFMDRLNNITDKSRETKTDTVLYLVEIDKFSKYRSEYGIAACDDLLKDIADWMKSHVSDRAIMARISDSSFGIIMSEKGLSPNELPKKLLSEIGSHLFEVSEQTLHVTFSIGGVTCHDNDLEPDKLVLHATAVSHKVQDNGGKGYELFNPSIDSLLNEEEKVLYDEFVHARDEGHMTLFYQPMMSLQGSPDQQYICYFRYKMQDGKWGLGKGIFPIFEKVGIDADIDKITFTHSLKMLAKEKAEGKATKLFLTLHPNTLLREDASRWVRQSIAKSGIDSKSLILTLKSHFAATYLKKAIELKDVFNKDGIQFCLSGVQADELELIQSVRPNYVAFDGRMIEVLKEQGTDKIAPLITATHNVGAKAIITNLEEASSLAQIWPLGVDFVTGNYISKPMSKLTHDFADNDF